MTPTNKVPFEILVKNRIKANGLVRKLIHFLQSQKLFWLEEVSLYDFLHSYVVGVFKRKIKCKSRSHCF